MTVRIDEALVFRLIEEKQPKTILVNAPGGLIRQTKELMEKARERYGVVCVFVGDSCFGICDTVEEDVERMKADMALHIGHNAAVETVGEHTYLVDAVDDVKFDNVVRKASTTLHGYKKLGLVTFSQHLHELGRAAQMFESEGFEVVMGTKNNLLLGSQIFGCDFSTVFPVRDKVDAFCFLGESEFHAVGLALAVGKPTYMLDPYTDEVTDMRDAAEERQKRAILAVYKALDARTFGVITGLKEGQKMLGRSNWIAKRLEMHGRKVVRLAMRDVTPDGLAPHREIEAVVQTAWPRISIDGFSFDWPVLSLPLGDALVGLLDGRQLSEFLLRRKWFELTVGLIPNVK